MRTMSRVGGLFALLFLVSCGSPQKPTGGGGGGGTSGSGAGGGTEGTATTVDPTSESICSRIYQLQLENCAMTQGFDLTQDECREDFRRSLEERGPEARTVTISLGHCLVDNQSCDAVAQCMMAMQQKEPGGFRECGTDGNDPVAMPASEWTTRKAAVVKRFSEATSTKEEPIEVCGIWEDEGQLDWLMTMTCDDGSHPFTGIHQAHASRIGNVGAGGRCASIIDLYEVPCPEGTHKIFIDAYVCPQK